MNIVVTANFSNGILSNGLQQNIVFLGELLEELGHRVFLLICHPRADCIDAPKHLTLVESENQSELPPLDIILQAGWCLNKGDVDGLKNKNPAAKNIHVHYGNRLLADIEQSLTDNFALDPYRVDEVWTSPHYTLGLPYFKTYYKTQRVFILPYIWSPRYLAAHSRIWKQAGKFCRYDPSRQKNIGIMEPNLNMTKNCIPSIFIVEELFDQRPELINSLYVYCTDRLRDKKHFRALMWNLKLQQSEKIHYSGRQAIARSFSHECNVVVSHQLYNALNYTYLEALYMDLPLVHNSEFLKDVGYYYPDYDIQLGAAQLLRALTEHDTNIETYKARASTLLWQFSPDNPLVKEGYERLLR